MLANMFAVAITTEQWVIIILILFLVLGGVGWGRRR